MNLNEVHSMISVG